MTRPIAVQLYSLREALQQDFEGTLEGVAKAGYVGVEMAGLYGRTPEVVAKLLQVLNLQVVAMHCKVLSPEELAASLAEAQALNCPNLVCPWVTPDTFSTLEGIHELAEKLNTATESIEAQGRKLLYHNHDFELQLVNDEPALNHFVKALDARVGIELDTYWVKVGGIDPVAMLNQLGDRVGLLHVKDGHIEPTHPMVAVGDGKLDYAPIIAALPDSVEWLIVELDACATDMIEAVTKSAHYLIEKGLGHGR